MTKRKSPPKPPSGAGKGKAYEKVKEAARKRASEVARRGRDIGKIPPPVSQARRDACERDLRLFCETYFPLTFQLKWSQDHLQVIGQMETSVLTGGLFATAMPRGSGKTSLAEVGCIWATAYGHRDYVALIGADKGQAVEMLDSIKTELSSNDLLAEDFPEVCIPIERLEGLANRCKGQLCEGERTRISWTEEKVILPTITGSKASGAIIRVGGITGRVRGMKFKRPDGKAVRPSLVVIDDPQTDESARSPSQCATRERILSGAILGLAGPGKKISAIMPCTVIAKGDVADNILDRKKHPEWHGTRTKMMYAFPVNDSLWEKYGAILKEDMESDVGMDRATEFYAANREAMDEGAVIAWPERFEPGEASAVQSAMNLKILRPEAFFAEFQNEPLAVAETRADDLTPDQITAKINGHDRGVVPMGSEHVTAFIDVQKTLLYYAVVAWEPGFGGNVLAYSAFPEQHRAYFTLNDAKVGISDVVKAPDLEGQLYAALESQVNQLAVREWPRDDGVPLKIERLLIDANWGESTNIVYKFCRQSIHSGILTPSHGKYIGASSAPMREWAKRQGERVGLNWRLRNMEGKRSVRSVIFDTNYWKSFLSNRLAVPMGSKSCLGFYGDRPTEHRMIADHLCSEYRVRTEGRGRTVDEWKQRPERPDNHWLDALVGCCVGAAMQGVTLGEASETAKPIKARVSFKDLQQRRNNPA